MKISLNWIKKYVDIKVPDDELIRLIGARLVEVEGVIDETSKYNNIYVAKVVSAEKKTLRSLILSSSSITKIFRCQMATFLMMVCFTIIRVSGYCHKKSLRNGKKIPIKSF